MDGWQLVADLLWAYLALTVTLGAAGVLAAHRSRRGAALALLLASALLLLAYSVITGSSIGRFVVLLPLLEISYAVSMGRGRPAVAASLVGSVVLYELCSWLLTPLVWPFGYLLGFWAVPIYLVLALGGLGWSWLNPPMSRTQPSPAR